MQFNRGCGVRLVCMIFFWIASGLAAEAQPDAEPVELPPRSARNDGVILSSFSTIEPAIKSAPAPFVINYEFRQPQTQPGQAAGFRVQVTHDFQIKVFASFAVNATQRSDWALMLDQSIDKQAAEDFVKWMAKKKLDRFDARATGEKCAELRKTAYPETAPNETLSVSYPGCAEPVVVFWRDLPHEAALFKSVPEVQALNAACEEIVKFAAAVCAEKSVLKEILKRE